MKKRLFYWSGPHVNVQKGNFIFDRLIKDNYEVKPYYDYNLGAGSDLKKRTRQFRKNILSLFLVSRKNDIIFAYDHTRSWILALLFSVLGLKRHVIINNYMYDGASKLKKQLLRIAFKNMRVAVNSPMIKNILIGDLGRNIENKIYVIPDCSEIFGSDFEQKWANTPRESNPPYIFTGGNTRRDFDMVINIAAKHPEWNFVIVAPNTEKNRFSTISENIKVFFQVSTNEFIEKLLAARIVFIPLKSDFQGGQLVLFEAALLNKPMVTTDTHAIRMYFDETSCGFIPKGNEKAAVEALKNVYNKPDEEIQQQCALAYKQIKKFSANYCYDLIRKMLEV